MKRPNDITGQIKFLTRWKFDILLSEYCLLEIVHKLQSNPGSEVPGYCYASNDYYALHLGITPRGIQKIKARMVEFGLLERHATVDQFVRTTKLFYDVHVLGMEYNKETRTQFVPPTNSGRTSHELSSSYTYSNLDSLLATIKKEILDFESLTILTEARYAQDSKVARREIWMMTEQLMDEDWFVTQWDYIAGALKEKVAQKRKKILKAWVDNAMWMHIRSYKINKVGNWIIRESKTKDNGKSGKGEVQQASGKYQYGKGGW